MEQLAKNTSPIEIVTKRPYKTTTGNNKKEKRQNAEPGKQEPAKNSSPTTNLTPGEERTSYTKQVTHSTNNNRRQKEKGRIAHTQTKACHTIKHNDNNNRYQKEKGSRAHTQTKAGNTIKRNTNTTGAS
jgi:hypothetical protein